MTTKENYGPSWNLVVGDPCDPLVLSATTRGRFFSGASGANTGPVASSSQTKAHSDKQCLLRRQVPGFPSKQRLSVPSVPLGIRAVIRHAQNEVAHFSGGLPIQEEAA
jgi:hypothetical protein